MPVPSHGGVPPKNNERSHCRYSKLFAKTEVHNGNVRPISVSHGSIKSHAMKLLRRDGIFFADCRARLSCKSIRVLRGSYKNRAFRNIEKRRRIKRGSKHDQTALRKEDECLSSSVIQMHGGECPKQRTC